MQDVAIFWDYENCPSPSNTSGCVVANSIRLMAQPYGRIKSFKAYLAITDQYTVARAVALRSEFQASGVSLIDCPHNGRKEVADKMIIVDMLTHAIDNPAPSTIILITGDRDFAYPMSILRLRQYEIILVTLSNAHFTLTAQASKCVDWFNDVLSSPAQPVGNSGGAVSGPTPVRCEIAPTRTVSSQSVQTVQEDNSEDPKKQINLLQYLRAASSTRYKRPSVSSSNYRSSHLGDPRQDTSPIIEVDLSPDGSSDNDQIPVSTTEIMHPKVDLSFSSQGITTEPSSGLTETDKPFSPGNQTPHHANSIDEPNTLKAPLSFTTFPPKIDEPSPYTPISTSVLQLGQPPVILENDESDIHLDDSDEEPNFIYPIRPASAPDTLPSPNPPAVSMVDDRSILSDVPSTINDPEEGIRTVTSVKENENQDNASQLAMLKEDVNGYSSFSFAAARPTVNPPGFVSTVSPFMSPVSPYIRPSPASALSPLAPAFNISNFSIPIVHPGFTHDKIHHFHNVKSEFSMPQSHNAFTPPASFASNAGATVSTWYSKISTSRDPLQPNFNSPPPKFGSFTPPIGTSAPPPPASSKSRDEIPLPPVVPSIFKILVRVLQAHKEKGQTRPTRSKVAVEISMNRTTYKKAGVEKFKQYTELAEQQEIIELGMEGSEAWIALRPAWWNADAT